MNNEKKFKEHNHVYNFYKKRKMKIFKYNTCFKISKIYI